MPDKTKEEILQDMLTDLAEHTVFTNVAPGSRVRALFEIIAQRLGEVYTSLERVESRAFVSRAQGAFLDLHAEKFGLVRHLGESDENLRYRITHFHESLPGKREAIRLAALSVPLVKTVHLMPFTHGGGSFSLYVIPHALEQMEETVILVEEAIADLVPEGIRAVVLAPRILEVRLDMVAVFADGVSESARTEARREARRVTKAYIDALDMGKPIVLAQMIHQILSARSELADIQLRRIEIDRRPLLIRNVVPYWDEKFYVRSLADIHVA